MPDRMNLTKEIFFHKSPLYPSRQREIIEWFNSAPVHVRYMVQDLIQDALLQQEFDHNNKVPFTLNNQEKKDA